VTNVSKPCSKAAFRGEEKRRVVSDELVGVVSNAIEGTHQWLSDEGIVGCSTGG
jgi:hypothetical protein